MATGETGFDDVTYDLVSVPFRDVMEQDSQRAHQCHEFLARLGGTDNTSPQG